MIKEELERNNFDKYFIESCYNAIHKHSADGKPETIEGLVVKDADKVSNVGLHRWERVIETKTKWVTMFDVLPKVRKELLHFEISKELYDKKVLELVEFLYKKILD